MRIFFYIIKLEFSPKPNYILLPITKYETRWPPILHEVKNREKINAKRLITFANGSFACVNIRAYETELDSANAW